MKVYGGASLGNIINSNKFKNEIKIKQKLYEPIETLIIINENYKSNKNYVWELK